MSTTPSRPLRILGIFAHPDDPEFSMGGSAARWADDGHDVMYCIVTDGSAGSNDPDQDLRELVRIREEEQRAAAAVLGVKEVHFLGYPDGMLEPTLQLRRDLTRLIRRLKPDRVVCGDPAAFFYGDEYINHADHRAAAEAAVTAVFPSAPTRPIFPELLAEGLEPHQVKELYITHDQDGPHTIHVDISTTIERKIEALRCHASQVQVGDGQWLRDWAAETGKAAGLAYAESFRVMILAREHQDGS
ncbi:MAG: PIG-L family deacetylase [Chloroflexi bacterium]|nr:PIG-L family deacetylase [Chloroflexota bacterium]